MTTTTININLDKKCSQCGKGGAEERTGLCLHCIERRLAGKPPILKGRPTAKACPKCGGILVIRQNKTTKHHFLGCERWSPEPGGCDYTEPLPEDVKMEALGAHRLPGF